MPFERYLRSDDYPISNGNDLSYYYQDYRHAGYDDADCHHIHGPHSYLPDYYDHRQPHAVQFQIPQFMLDGPPSGGAEVLPAGFLGNGPESIASSWFANNGFAPFHSSLISRQFTSSATPRDNTESPSYPTFRPHGSQHPLPRFSPRVTAAASMGPRQHVPRSSPSVEVNKNYIPNTSPCQPAGPSSTASYAPHDSESAPSLPLAVPSTLSLPVYSASGFDVLSILSRVVNRPNPTIQLGPVDLSCSFVIVDVKRHDCPIVYTSPTFCHLTGYSEQEVLGRNCRFLQSPTGSVAMGEPRRFTSPEAVSCMRTMLSSSKECQTSLINYRKGGQAFINLVTVIPLYGGIHNTPEEADQVVYHIGFQVDLSEQPSRMLDKLHDGNYHSVDGLRAVDGVSGNGTYHGFSSLGPAQNMTNIGLKGRRHGQIMSMALSKELRNLIADPTFTNSVPITTGTNASGPTSASSGSTEQDNNTTTPLTMLVTPPSSSTSMNRMSVSGNPMAASIPVSLSPSLSLLLLEFLPDFLLVLSLKGAFLYVAPSVRLVLGYESQELVGKGISDVCHPADLVPLMRELKEGSMSGLGIPGASDVGSSMGMAAASNLSPKSVDLLFRALPKTSTLSQQSTFTGHDRTCASQTSARTASGSRLPPSSTPSSSNDFSDETASPYIWLECRGRLHVEPGKGRKAIILSGRARWMPVVRRGSLDKAGGIGGVWCQGDNTHGASRMTAGSKLQGTAPGELAGASINPSEFWALLSSQGTFLVASASVRDVLGWGTSEVIGRSICAMVRNNGNGARQRVEAELAKLDTLENGNVADPPPSVVITSLMHRESHTVLMRLAFYRTPRSEGLSPPSASPIHPLNNPSCPIVCQATVLSDDAEHLSNKNPDTSSSQAPSRVQIRINSEDDTNEPDSSKHPSGASLFEELGAGRGSSWQYELQQLKFANQRLYEELHALEGGSASGSSSSAQGCTAAVTHSQPCPPAASTAAIILPHSKPHYTPAVQSTLPTSLASLRPSNGLHERDPPTSDWSSLTGANGRGPNPLKRSWHSEDGPTT